MVAHTSGSGFTQNLVLGVSPFTVPDARLVSAVCRAGGLGVLDLGAGDRRAREALDLLLSWAGGPFGVRVTGACALQPDDLPRDHVHTVLLGHDAKWSIPDLAAHHRVLVEVTSRAEAVQAAERGAHGIVARGEEAGGPVGELSTFVLLQQLVDAVDLPVWAWGGIGAHTAAAAVVGGAAGVVLDTQLALLSESDVDDEIAAAIRPMDGSETTIVDGARLLARRGASQARIPVGQDGFLATRFADEHGTVDRAVRAVKDAVLTALAQEPSGPSMIAQGPMTRVSDQRGFRRRGRRGRRRCRSSRWRWRPRSRPERCSGRHARPRSAIAPGASASSASRPRRSARPRSSRSSRSCARRYAIIAGGRPAQAAALEAAGITTFLHVPSPGLLRQFLDAGARQVRLRGLGMRRPRRPARQLPVVGGAARRSRWTSSAPTRTPTSWTCCSPAASTTRGRRRWSAALAAPLRRRRGATSAC